MQESLQAQLAKLDSLDRLTEYEEWAVFVEQQLEAIDDFKNEMVHAQDWETVNRLKGRIEQASAIVNMEDLVYHYKAHIKEAMEAPAGGDE